MNEERRLVHVERIAIRWGDMDAMGHVNNTIYFRYLEIVRVEWLPPSGKPASTTSSLLNAFPSKS